MEALAIICAALAGLGVGFWLACAMAKGDGQIAKLLKNQLDEAQGELDRQKGLNIALETEKRIVGEQLVQLQAQFKTQFENLANSILEKNSEKFTAQSQLRLQELLNPLKERLGEFQKKVDESFSTQGKEQFSLKEEIRRIVDTHEKMRLQTDNLTKALKGDVKAQGNWGEMILERLFEMAGLVKGKHYVAQGEGMGLRHVEDGSLLKPDFIVYLPEGRHAIVDSKVSLTHYERLSSEADEAQRVMHLKQYLQSVRMHVNGLTERRYQDTAKLGAPDFVLMFMPIEGAYALAMQQDAELHHYAWDRRVVIVCSSTLFATLRIVESLWKIEGQNRNAEEIARRGGELYDKIAGFVADMQKIDGKLGEAKDAYDEAIKKLSTGRGNVLRQVEMLKELGAKASKDKQLPKELLDDVGEEMPLLEDAS